MVDLSGILVSASPFVVAAVGLAALGWPAPVAGAASLATAVVGALVWPGLRAAAVPGALLGGLGTAAQVLYVLFGGLLLYNLLSAVALWLRYRSSSGGWSRIAYRSRPWS